MAVTMSALRADQTLPPERAYGATFYYRLRARAMIRLKGFGKIKKKSMTSSGLEPATFRLVA
jgi:hypothetical protein